MAEPFTNYTLDTIAESADTLIVRLTAPTGGEMQSTRIAFLPGGYIVIHGDLAPGPGNGLISNGGYGLGWFGGGQKSASYLAEKFRIPQVFIPRHAAEHLRELANDEEEVRATLIRELADDADDMHPEGEDLYDFLRRVEDVTGSPDHAEAFFGPDPETLGLLVEIQAAFARLYRAGVTP